jgi:hypothetical protein
MQGFLMIDRRQDVDPKISRLRDRLAAVFQGGPAMKQIVSVIAAFALLIQMSGCSVRKVKQVKILDLQNPAIERIVGITTKTGGEITFNPPGAIVRNNNLEASVNNKPYSISMDQIERFWVERREISALRTIGLTVGLVVGAIGVLVIIAVATKESCPFVYSWDGQKYVFDGEPYGAAITRGLERDDYSELERLVPDKGLYRLMISNEVAETQYTNLMELFVTDHRSDRIAMDSDGNLYTITSVQAPTAAVDETGQDLLPWFKATDRRIWEPDPETNPGASVRQEIRITFPKPESASTTKLLVNSATSLWGSYMIKELSELRGDSINDWYAAIDNSEQDRAALQAWSEREELFNLKIDVEEEGRWVQRGWLLGGGPFVLEDRVVSLDTSQVKGNRLNIRIRPPKGFWAFNSFAVDCTPNLPVELMTLHPIECRDSDGLDRLAQIAANDDSYYEMTNIGNRGYISFNAPPLRPDMKRTVILHTRGYYKLHLDSKGQPNQDLLTRIMTVPDALARFSGMRFPAWQAEKAALGASPRK